MNLILFEIAPGSSVWALKYGESFKAANFLCTRRWSFTWDWSVAYFEAMRDAIFLKMVFRFRDGAEDDER